MAKHSRFDNLEGKRPVGKPSEAEPAPRPTATLERFEGLDGQPARSDAAPSPGRFSSDVRFASDGTDAVRTNDDELAALPSLECPTCGTQCSKFVVACHSCGSRLDSAEAVAHNRARLEAFRAEQEQARASEAARREVDLEAARKHREEAQAGLKEQLGAIKREYDAKFESAPSWLAGWSGRWSGGTSRLVWAAVVLVIVALTPRGTGYGRHGTLSLLQVALLGLAVAAWFGVRWWRGRQ